MELRNSSYWQRIRRGTSDRTRRGDYDYHRYERRQDGNVCDYRHGTGAATAARLSGAFRHDHSYRATVQCGE
jgi:hypothetical protein